METYKIKHVPTGLYIVGSTVSNGYSTLGKKGKCFNTPIAWTKIQKGTSYKTVTIGEDNSLFDEFAKKFSQYVVNGSFYNYIIIPTNASDFEKEIVEVKDENQMRASRMKAPKEVLNFVDSGLLSKGLDSLHGNCGFSGYDSCWGNFSTAKKDEFTLKQMEEIIKLTGEKKLFVLDKGRKSFEYYATENSHLGKRVGKVTINCLDSKLDCIIRVFDFKDFKIYEADCIGSVFRSTAYFINVVRVTLPPYKGVMSEYKVFTSK